MKSFHRILAAAAVFAFAGLTSEVFAQTNSLFGNTGGTGAAAGRTTGGLTGGSGLGGAAAGGLGTRQGAAGGLGGAQGGFGAGAAGTGGAGTGGAGFIGRNANAGRFVGQQQAGNQTGRTNRTFRGAQTAGDPTQVNRNAALNRNGGGGTQQTVRPVLRVAFTYPRRAMTTIRTNVRSRFQKLAARQTRFQGITLDIDDAGQVVLRGSVESENVRSLAANLARLEPGVRKVQNELTVRK